MIVNSIFHWARKKPEKIAIDCMGVKVTYHYFATAIISAYSALSSKQLEADKIAIVAITDPIISWCVLFACKMLGLNTLVVSRFTERTVQLFSRVDYLITVEEEAHPDVLSFDSPIKAVKISANLFATQHLNSLKTNLNARYEILTGGNILLTSGSTGISKKILLSNSDELARTEMKCKHQNTTSKSIVFSLNYAIHAASGYNLPVAAWHKGGQVIFSSETQWVHDFFTKVFSSVTLRPSHIEEIKKTASFYKSHISKSVEINCGGGFIPFSNFNWLKENFSLLVYNQYAASETATIARTLVNEESDIAWHKPNKGIFYKIVNDIGNELPLGEMGLIGFKIEKYSACSSYFDLEDEDEQSRFSNGYFFPGDYAIARADGRFRLLGRQGDGVLLKEKVIPSRIIEEDLETQLGVSAVLVFSHQNKIFEDEVVVIIERLEPLEREQSSFINSKFSDITSVKIILLNAFIMTPAGKVDRNKIISEVKKSLD